MGGRISRLSRAAAAAAGLIAAGLVSGPAMAGGDIAPGGYDTVPAPVGRTIWEGFHVGGQIGGADIDYGASGAGGLTGDDEGDGVIGGIVYGTSWQFGQWVVGTDSDFSFSDAESGAFTDGVDTATAETNWSSSSRVRAGHLVTPNLLVYGTVGIAFADIDVSGSLTGSQDERFFGVQYGGGIETTFRGRYFLRAEYLHTDYGDENFGTGGGGAPLNLDPDSDVVRAAVGYRFNWTPLDLLTGS